MSTDQQIDKIKIYGIKYDYWMDCVNRVKFKTNMVGGTKFKIISKAIHDKQPISSKHSLEKGNETPDVEWDNIPVGTKDFLLILYDLDSVSEKNWIHWLVFNIDPNTKNLIKTKYTEGTNSFGENGYGGPAPPETTGVHKYVLIIYALKEKLNLDAERKYTFKEIQNLLEGLINAKAETIGTYQFQE